MFLQTLALNDGIYQHVYFLVLNVVTQISSILWVHMLMVLNVAGAQVLH